MGIEHELYQMMMQCLQSAHYAGAEFQAKSEKWLEDSQCVDQLQLVDGWKKLYAEYELLAEDHWQSVWKKIEDGNVVGLKQGDLFA
jgi:hypothetical protein